MKIIESLLLLALTVGLIFLWWKLFKLGNKKRRETLEIAAKQLNLMSREKITGKRVARLVFYAALITVLVFGGSAVITKLLGN